MSDFFPTLDDVQHPLTLDVVETLEKTYKRELPNASTQSKFNLAWAYVKSNNASEQRRGLDLLVQIYRDSPQRRRECLFYLALGSYKLGDYTTARKYTDTLLQYEPNNKQVLHLRQEIENKLSKEGMIGLAIVGTAAATAIGVAATVLGVTLGRRR